MLSSLLSSSAAAPLGEARPDAADVSEVDDDTRQHAVQRALDGYRLLVTAVNAFGLEGAHTWKPLLDGKQVDVGAPCSVCEEQDGKRCIHTPMHMLQVMQLTGAKGPAVGEITAKVIRWQLANPSGTVDECVAFLNATK